MAILKWDHLRQAKRGAGQVLGLPMKRPSQPTRINPRIALSKVPKNTNQERVKQAALPYTARHVERRFGHRRIQPDSLVELA